jgi:glutathione synthase/RimK-type ligase-like ATP-grasp enzyme
MNKQTDIILVLASRLDAHADAIVSHCYERKIHVVRLDVEDFWPNASTINWTVTNETSSAILDWQGRRIDTDHVFSIYCRDFSFAKCNPSEDIRTQLIYAEARASLYGFFRCLENIYWMNPPWYDELADNKLYQTDCARKIGFTVPKTLVTNDPQAFLNFYKECNQNVIIKQLSEICLIDDSELQNAEHSHDSEATAYGFYTQKIRPEHLDKIEEIIITPCLFQENIKKKADIRVTVVGDQVFSALIDSQGHPETVIDFRLKLDLPIHHFELSEAISHKLVNLIHSWNLEFATCDFILTPENKLVFLEVNVEGNWLWIEHELGLAISKAITEHLVGNKNF